MTTPTPHPSSEPCRICGGRLLCAFEGLLFGDTPVRYGTCESCRPLTLPWVGKDSLHVFTPPDYSLPAWGRMRVRMSHRRRERRARKDAYA